jgi:hypothetical protein
MESKNIMQEKLPPTIVMTSLTNPNDFFIFRPDGRELKISIRELERMKDPRIPGPKKLTLEEFEDLKKYVYG